jgi:hypothetical protein
MSSLEYMRGEKTINMFNRYNCIKDTDNQLNIKNNKRVESQKRWWKVFREGLKHDTKH